MKIIIIHKEPIVERIPNLKAFIVYASLNSHKVVLLTTKSKIYPEPTFLNENIQYLTVSERISQFQLPTSIRFYALCLSVLLSNSFQKYALVLAGKYALVFGSFLKHVKSFSSFIIEYPKLGNEDINRLDKLESKAIVHSKFLITHDALHAQFIAEKLNIRNLSFTTIPNGTIGKASKQHSRLLHNRLNLNHDRKLVLHSGGFGEWFESCELSKQSLSLPEEFELVFHVSHDISKDDYYIDYLKNKYEEEKTIFSMKPVATNELDSLISSAYIGIAWYSKKVLGYRATMLGLAAGKIGNYLKCGIPVIVPDYISLNYVSEYACGIQISNLAELNNAIYDINKNYSVFSENALKCYNELWNTEKYCEELLQRLDFVK